ncbi:DUF5979 domain-containing protein [Corynebacterium tapiri]|uniref:LPXTG cell wall anchor domain-containing protein n=1 Tax=Corynebacterium tapiri TaxID=1448266 RepID=A0A5C4U2D4_9CORY|nr:DUF5979 domain-containing protein [Corynebacterium tapiri]TNL96637.1 LPXTG cell wall anchor domain-containing protein [Corynebacterium tapiri]
MTHQLHPRTMARRALAIALTMLVVIVAHLMPVAVPWQTAPTAQAQASNGSFLMGNDWNNTGCEFRQAPGDMGQICWLSMEDFVPTTSGFLGTTSLDYSLRTRTHRLGPYTLTYTLKLNTYGGRNNTGGLVVGANAATNASAGVFGRIANGMDVWVKNAASSMQTVVETDHSNLDRRGYEFTMTDIKITDPNGNPVTDYRIAGADAESTDGYEDYGERLQFDASPGNVDIDTPVIPSGYRTCERGMGPGQEQWGSYSPQPPAAKDFICWVYGKNTPDQVSGGGRTSGNVGTYLVSSPSPTRFQTTTWSSKGRQAFAIGIPMGRMTGSVTQPDTTFERNVTGSATQFNFSMALKSGDAVTNLPYQNNNYTPVVRQVNRDMKATDTQLFRSKASNGSLSPQVIGGRYQPRWQCTIGSTTTTIEPGNVPAGFTLSDHTTSGESVLGVTNPDNLIADCDVSWRAKFTPASLTLNKQVTGSAQNSQELRLRQFDLNYVCKDPSTFAAAYPQVKLSGTARLAAGGTQTINNLPAGAECTVTEGFTDNTGKQVPPAQPGNALDVQWSSGTMSQPDQNGVRSTTLRLNNGSNVVGATNKYDQRTADLTINKTILGPPVAAMTKPRDYVFEVRCTGANYVREVTLTLNGTTTASGSNVLKGVPVATDCVLTPKTGLSNAESDKYTFDGRKVTLQGAPIAEQASPVNTYKFSIADRTTQATINIEASYSYQARDVEVVKELAGPAAGSPLLSDATFRAQYECAVPNNSAVAPKTGTVDISTLASGKQIAKIPAVPVGAQCKVWEQSAPDIAGLKLDATVVAATNGTGATTALPNNDAKTKPVLTVSNATLPGQNRVVVRNSYSTQLGTVSLTKVVAGTAQNVPSTFTVNFTCGQRSVVVNGVVTPVQLKGTAQITTGQTIRLTYSDPNAPSGVNANQINDQNGAMGVPYGNTCTFSEPTPKDVPAGVQWSTDAGSKSLKIAAANTPVTITNTFVPLGQGLTINHRPTNMPTLAQPMTYSLVCTLPTAPAPAAPMPQTAPRAADGTTGGTQPSPTPTPTETNQPTDTAQPVAYQAAQLAGMNYTKTITLAPGESTQIPASDLPKGSSCTLTETSTDPLTREAGGTRFPIKRQVTVDNGSSPAAEFNGSDKVTSKFTISDNSQVTISPNYDYVYGKVTATKQVAFDPETAQYISQARKDAKRSRDFSVKLICTPPGESTPITATGVVKHDGHIVLRDSIRLGARCTASEDIVATDDGISLKQEVGVNDQAASVGKQDFTITGENTKVTFTNTYSRVLTDVVVDKVASLPANVQGDYAAAGQKIPYYTHNFSMVCRDPQTDANTPGSEIGTFNTTITGPGKGTFTKIPVGADCQITGDKFGELKLSLNNGGVEATVRPEYIDWVVTRNDGTTFKDTDLADGSTTSQTFQTTPSRDGKPTTTLTLTNHYQYDLAPVQLAKEVVIDEKDSKLLGDDYQFKFGYTCRAVGFQTAQVGYTNDTTKQPTYLPETLQWAQFKKEGTTQDGKQRYRFESPLADMPVGTECTFTEQEPQVPKQLTWRVEPEKQVTKKVQPRPAVDVWEFRNVYDHRKVAVAVAPMQDGYLKGLTGDYTYNFTCKDGAQTKAELTVSAAAGTTTSDITSKSAPTRAGTVMLPVGVDCEVTLSGSALDPRTVLEWTSGSRSPFVQFGVWREGTAVEGNPKRAGTDYAPNEVTPGMKNNTFTFNVPVDVVSAEIAPAYMVGSEATHLRDTVTLTLGKRVAGEAGKGGEFHFTSECFASPEGVTLRAGTSAKMDGIPVDQDCNIVETSDGIDKADPVLTVAETGELLQDVTVKNQQTGSTEQSVDLAVKPVAQASDNSTEGPKWAVTLLNSYPGISVDKHIKGAPISAITGAVADTAVLPDDATEMQFTYRIKNTGAMSAKDVAITEKELAGKTIRANGQEFVVDAQGTIPSKVCQVPELEPKETHECTFTVPIDVPADQHYSYKGTVGVTAVAGTSQLTAEDTYGAIRPTGILGWMLPDTGVQTLVWVILLGLIALGLGLWSYLRGRDEDTDEDIQEEE